MRRCLCSWARGLGATRLPLLLLLLGLLPGAAQETGCAYPGPLTNGVVQEEQTHYKIGSEITYSCNLGFRLVGESASECVYVKGEAGWSNSLPRCEPVKCKDIITGGGTKVSASGPRNYGKTLTFECRPGYVMKGSNISRCDENGDWKPKFPTCEKNTSCAYPGPLTNGVVQEEQTHYKIGSEVTYSCNLGFRLVGESASECVYVKGEAGWSNSLPRCEPVKCKDIITGGGTKVSASGPRNYGKTLTFECRPGYVMKGSNISRCDENGDWKPKFPTCERNISCAYPGPLTNGVVQEEQTNYKIGSEVTYSCNPGFRLVGDSSSVCVSQGREVKWSTPLPSCERTVKCENPEVTHGIMLTGLGALHTYGNTVTFECKIGYYMVGSYINRCDENGSWYPKLPTCEKIGPQVCGAPFIVNGTIQLLFPTYAMGMSITITCNVDNSFPDDTVEMTTECQGYNVWNPPVRPCLSRTSPDISPLKIQNGAIIEGKKQHYEPGDSVVVSCNAGYTLIGPSNIRYIGGKKWTPYMPTCSLNFLLVMLIIVFLLMLFWLLADLSYRRYCKQKAKENVGPPVEVISMPPEVMPNRIENKELIIEDLSDGD